MRTTISFTPRSRRQLTGIEPLEARIAPAFGAVINLADLTGADGFKVRGVADSDFSGYSVSDAGDVNGDGFADVLIGAVRADEGGVNRGASYVVFGKTGGFGASFDLAALNGINGFKVSGVADNDASGRAVSAAGDVNGDGFADLIIGADSADSARGAAYVVFGHAGAFIPALSLSTLSGTDGFKISGAAFSDRAGISVSGAGDVNGDGFDDVIIGAPQANGSGAAYLVFGHAGGFTSVVALSTLGGTDGFKLSGVGSADQAGFAVGAAGDVNGDGFGDVIIGARFANEGGSDRGAAYVVFGKAGGFAASISLSALAGTDGFKLSGVANNDLAGTAVSAAGDMNGDGFGDLIIGADVALVGANARGTAYVVFGKASFTAQVALASLNGTSGFALTGAGNYDHTAFSVAGAGDINGDGFADVIVGAKYAAEGGTLRGASYVVFGKKSSFNPTLALSALDGTNGFKLRGVANGDESGYSVSGVGDVNGDGLADLIIGALSADEGGAGSNRGASYIVFGRAEATPTPFGSILNLSDLTAGKGLKLLGEASGDGSGYSVSSAGDINGDGIDDVIVGARFVNTTGGIQSGASYVVFGSSAGFPASLNFSALTGSNGFKISGAAAYDFSGRSVSAAGDINGDGIDDLIIGADQADANGNANSGASYIVFGSRAAFAANLDLSALNGSNGFKLSGEAANDISGKSVSGAGDINGDGIGDLIIGAPGTDQHGNYTGTSYVVFGSRAGFAPNVNLSALNGSNGFKIIGTSVYDGSGASVSGAGDINGDGIDDLIIGAVPGGNASYVVFGSRAAFPATLDLATPLSGVNGFKVSGAAANDSAGFSVSAGGDINGDGIDDVIIGAYHADPHGNNSGASYVVFGSRAGFAANVNLSALTGLNGFRLAGGAAFDYAGFSVSGAGDINGDGIDDLIVGAPEASPNGGYSGASYIVFGSRAGFGPTMDLSKLTAAAGFKLEGAAAGDRAGNSVRGAGDFNGDGIGDLIVGAPLSDPSGSTSGTSYIVFGHRAPAVPRVFAPAIDLSSLTGTTGFKLTGVADGDNAGGSVRSAGDVNGDGFDDLIIGAIFADEGGVGNANRGATYVVFGKAGGFGTNGVFALGSLDGTNGFKLSGVADGDLSGFSVSAAGDVNGDGFDDVIIGARNADNNRGASYVIFGKSSFVATPTPGFAIALSALDGTNGFKLSGVANYDNSGSSVSTAGDVNGDGFDDVIIGARYAAEGGNRRGASYVVFGKAGGFGTNGVFALSALDGTNGFKLSGVANSDFAGYSVSTAGDVNGDGFDDLIIGAQNADEGGVDRGASYVVFGKASFSATAGTLALATLNGTNGFKLSGVADNDRAGISVSAAGDVNGDGFDDLVIGAEGANEGGIDRGAGYVVFGRSDFSATAGTFALSALDGSNGFKLSGAADNNRAGHAVSAAGDVNGDGFDDLIIGAYRADEGGSDRGATYVVFGKAGGFIATRVLSALDGSSGFKLSGVADQDESGYSVSAAGDVNGDGLADFIIGAPHATEGVSVPGTSYVIFGRPSAARAPIAPVVNLANLTGIDGTKFQGVAAGDDAGFSVSEAGDINGDGIGDLIIGAIGASANGTFSGTSYVVFGSLAGFARTLNLANLSGPDGFKIQGEAAGDLSGQVVSKAGDINGDGIDDLIISAPAAAPSGSQSGASYVVFGSRAGFGPIFNLSALTGANGFKISGQTAGDRSGISVSEAGDINGDGIGDLIVGADSASPNGSQSGASYVVFGSRAAFGAALQLSSLTPAQGFKIQGEATQDFAGISVSSAGDFNGDGIGDLLIGASGTNANGGDAGAGYVVFGSRAGFGSALNLSSLTGPNGFKIKGESAYDGFGVSVSGIGDMNGDGLADIVVGANILGEQGQNHGDSYVIFGTRANVGATLDLTSLTGANGFKIVRAAINDYSGFAVSGAGDINGDGIGDLIIGAPRSAPNGASSGTSYVIFGTRAGFGPTLDLASLAGANGFQLQGGAASDRAGKSVSGAGDVNGDGIDDLLVGAYGNASLAGASYVVYGQRALIAAAPTGADLEVTLVNGDLVITDLVGSGEAISIQSDVANNRFIILAPDNSLGFTNVLGATLSADLHTITVPFSTVNGTTLFVNLADGDDTLTVDFSLGNFSKQINYDGGSNTSIGDSLELVGGGTFSAATFTFDDLYSGSIDIIGTSKIFYAGLEPIYSSITASSTTLQYGDADDIITVTDAGGGFTTVTSTAGETLTFVNPIYAPFPNTGSLTILGGGGADTINVNSLDANFNAELYVDTQGGGADNVNLAAGLPALRGLVVATEFLGTLPALTINGPRGLEVTVFQSGVNIGGTIDATGFSVNFDVNGTITSAAGTVVKALGVGATAVSGIDLLTDADFLSARIVNGQLRLEEAGSVGISDLDAGSGEIVLLGGTFTLIRNDVLHDASAISISNATLDLGAFHDTVTGVTLISGRIAGTGRLTSVDTGSSTGGFTLLSGSVDAELAGTGPIIKLGADTVSLENNGNSFIGQVTILGGVLQVAGDGALGDYTNAVSFAGGTLRTLTAFTSGRSFLQDNGNGIVDVAGPSLTLLGVTDPAAQASLLANKLGTGTLRFATVFDPNPANAGARATIINGASIAVRGGGNATVNLVTINGVTVIDTITLNNTDSRSTLTLKNPNPAGAPIVIGHIVSSDPNQQVGSIFLGPGIILGDGAIDSVPEIDIAGKIGKLQLDQISTGALVRIGTGLPYNVTKANGRPDTRTPDTYNFHPTLTVEKVLGPGVIIDVTGNGLGPDEGGIGGGGLGKVTFGEWAFPGKIKTTQSIEKLTVKNGDFFASLEVDKFHKGELTTANVGAIAIVNGAWGGSGTEIEGNVKSFNANEFLAGATLQAGSMGKAKTDAGDFAGTIILSDPDSKSLPVFTVKSNFTGTVMSEGSLGKIAVKGDFSGSLEALFIGAISAFSFTGADGGSSITATMGSLGTLTASAGAVKDFTIVTPLAFGGLNVKLSKVVGDMAGIDNVSLTAASIGKISVSLGALNGTSGANLLGIRDSEFITTGTGTTKQELGSIGNVSVKLAGVSGGASAIGIQNSTFDARVVAGEFGLNASTVNPLGSIAVKVTGSGGGTIGLDRVTFEGDTIGAAKVTVGAASGGTAHAAETVAFTATRSIGALTFDGDATSAQVTGLLVNAGWAVGAVSVKSKDSAQGSLVDSAILSGQKLDLNNLAAAAKDVLDELKRGTLGAIKLTGSLLNSKLVSASNIAAITVGGNASDSLILAGARLGGDFEIDGNELYTRAAAIAAVTVNGSLARTSIAAGVNPGNASFGEADDVAGAVHTQLTAAASSSFIGNVKIGLGTAPAAAALAHFFAIEAASIKSFKIGAAAAVKIFEPSLFLSAGGGAEAAADIGLRLIA